MKKKEVWKFKIGHSLSEIEMPYDAELLTVHEQGGSITLWAAVDPTASYAKRLVQVVATGEPFERTKGMDFVGTVFIDGLVWHVWDLGYPV